MPRKPPEDEMADCCLDPHNPVPNLILYSDPDPVRNLSPDPDPDPDAQTTCCRLVMRWQICMTGSNISAASRMRSFLRNSSEHPDQVHSYHNLPYLTFHLIDFDLIGYDLID